METNYFMRAIGCILAIITLLTLAACGQQVQQPSQMPDPDQEVQESDTNKKEATLGTSQPEEAEPDTSTIGKTLVIYYSATGNTASVAEYIAGALEADTFEIVPAEPYTSEDLNWTNENSRVNKEHNDPSLRTMELQASAVDDWASYDTVFIGYPIWWGGAAWPVDSFIAANDFTGKTVIPFCTSSSSGLGESDGLLAEMAGTGKWLEGQRFRSSASENDVVEWVNSLGITSES